MKQSAIRTQTKKNLQKHMLPQMYALKRTQDKPHYDCNPIDKENCGMRVHLTIYPQIRNNILYIHICMGAEPQIREIKQHNYPVATK